MTAGQLSGVISRFAFAVAAVGAVIGADAAPGAQAPVFNARVDAVRVDVAVQRGNKPLAGLTADDFEILDNGVPQRVELLSPTSLPLNVVLALDASSSLDAEDRDHLTAAGGRVVDALRPTETAALLTFSGRIAVQTSFTDDRPRLRALLGTPAQLGDTALYDAAHVAMLLGTTAPGRPIVLLFSDGEDTVSVLTREAVLDTARRTGAVVCVVALGEPDPVLARLAAETGGIFLKETSLDRVATRFGEILESFRHRYLISFTPTGVPREGWHTLAVRVKSGGEVRARTGYWRWTSY
jgi:VWFA-related protein